MPSSLREASVREAERRSDEKADAKTSAKREKLWERHRRVIAKAIARDPHAFDERWEAAAAIIEHEPPLYLIGGHQNAADFLRAVLREAPRTAFRNIRVAKYASAAQREKLGVSKIDAALSFLEAKTGKPLGKSLPTELKKLRIPVADRGRKATVTLADASVVEIAEATKRLLKKTGKSRKKRKPEPPKKTLQAFLRKTEALAEVVVKEKNGLVTFKAVPLTALEAFVTALSKAKRAKN